MRRAVPISKPGKSGCSTGSPQTFLPQARECVTRFSEPAPFWRQTPKRAPTSFSLTACPPPEPSLCAQSSRPADPADNPIPSKAACSLLVSFPLLPPRPNTSPLFREYNERKYLGGKRGSTCFKITAIVRGAEIFIPFAPAVIASDKPESPVLQAPWGPWGQWGPRAQQALQGQRGRPGLRALQGLPDLQEQPAPQVPWALPDRRGPRAPRDRRVRRGLPDRQAAPQGQREPPGYEGPQAIPAPAGAGIACGPSYPGGSRWPCGAACRSGSPRRTLRSRGARGPRRSGKAHGTCGAGCSCKSGSPCRALSPGRPRWPCRACCARGPHWPHGPHGACSTGDSGLSEAITAGAKGIKISAPRTIAVILKQVDPRFPPKYFLSLYSRKRGEVFGRGGRSGKETRRLQAAFEGIGLSAGSAGRELCAQRDGSGGGHAVKLNEVGALFGVCLQNGAGSEKRVTHSLACGKKVCGLPVEQPLFPGFDIGTALLNQLLPGRRGEEQQAVVDVEHKAGGVAGGGVEQMPARLGEIQPPFGPW